MKKLIALILCVLLVAALGITAFAAEGTTITVTASKTQVNRGDKVTVTINMSSSDEITSLGYIPFAGNYESDYFTVGKRTIVNDGKVGAAKPKFADFSRTDGLSLSAWVEEDENGDDVDVAVVINGDIATFEITIKENAPFGKFTVTDVYKVANGSTELDVKLVETELEVVCTSHSYADTWTNAGDKHTKTCSACGNVQEADHAWDAGKVTTDPTCKDTGVKTFTCADCGATKTADVEKTTNHKYGAWTAAGDEHTKTCSVCGDVQKAAHAWSEKVTKEATCKEEGVLTKTCADCGATKTESIDKTTDHKSDKWEKVDEKTHKGTCSVCAQEVAVEHAYEEKVTKEATCKEEGEKTLTCACGEVVTEKIAKTTDHKYDEGKVTTEATTEKEGVKTYTCTVCGETKTEAVAKLPASSNSDTGDNTMMIPLMILVVLSGFGLALTVIGKKKFAR